MQDSSTQASSTQVGSTQVSSNRTSQASVSAALAAANAALRDFPSMRLGRPDSGRSLADMAQRDLDAALQLLTDRAQYITGSSGAAIALRRYGTNDMLCRASTGSSAPELGTLLSTEFGLSGESVRTRRALRCDDAERDARVNHDVCREVGIASVVVMPVVHDDEVLGVFELFSGNAHAFGERDMSALQRLSEMVETAVRLAMAAQSIPERLKAPEVSVASSELTSEKAAAALETQASGGPIAEKHEESDGLVIDDPIVEVEAESAQERPAVVFAATPPDTARSTPVGTKAAAVAATAETARIIPPTPNLNVSPAPMASASAANTAEAPPVFLKPLLWSAASNATGDAGSSGETDQSHVPPVFRNLRKCEACGFPVSAERALCVECEEKKWRGQLKPRVAAASPAPEIRRDLAGAPPAAAPAPARELAPDAKLSTVASSVPQGLKPDTGAQTVGTAGSRALPVAGLAPAAVPVTPLAAANGTEPKTASAQTPAVDSTPATAKLAAAAPELVFSATLEPSQSWFGRNKYVLGALLAVAGTVAAILLLR